MKKYSNRQKLDSIYRQETIRTVGVVLSIILQGVIALHLFGVI